jgi:hypothetical protein
MFTIIGGDGREYGPVSAAQIKLWIASGRAGLETQAKRAGTNEWKRLGDLPEFVGGEEEPPPLSGTPATPGPAPRPRDAEAIASYLSRRAARLDISSCYERSWHLLKAHFWPLVGVTALLYVLQCVLGFLPLGQFLLIPVSLLVMGSFKGGLSYYVLKTIRGQPATLKDAFIGFTVFFLPLLLAGVITFSFTLLGACLLILPGVYLAVAYLFTYLLIIDQRMDFWTAMEVSRRVVTTQWWRIFGLGLVGVLFLLLGLSLFLVGFLAALPLFEGAIVYAYEDLFSTPASATEP